MNNKREIKRLRAVVRSYIGKAMDAYIDGNAESYNFWTHAAMEMNDKILTMTGFKARARNAKRYKTVYVPVGRETA